jgi:hypothetical protein
MITNDEAPDTVTDTIDQTDPSRSSPFARRQFMRALGIAGVGGIANSAAASTTDEPTQNDPPESKELLAANVEESSYWERVMFTCFQGIINRDATEVFLNGLRSVDSSAEDNVFLEWYKQYENLSFRELNDPYALFDELELDSIAGYVLVDTTAPITVNIAANYASIESLLPVTEEILQNDSMPDLEIERNLQGDFTPDNGSGTVNFGEMDHIEVYEWAIEHQWPKTNHALTTLLSTPPAQTSDDSDINITIYTTNGIRDYTVAERGFFFELSSSLQDKEERALKGKILDEMDSFGYVLGWHVDRDSEGDHIRHLSEYGQLALGGATYADNFSFHSRVELPGDPVNRFKQRAEQLQTVDAVDDNIYLTFIMSDGDSINHITRNAHGGQWLFPERGEMPFGWEIQPALADIAPGILDYFQATATENDYFVASASGLGYVYPSYMPEGIFEDYLEVTEPYLSRTGMSSLTVLNNYQSVSENKRNMYSNILGDELTGMIQGYTRAPGMTQLYHQDSPSDDERDEEDDERDEEDDERDEEDDERDEEDDERDEEDDERDEGQIPVRARDATAWLSTVLPEEHQDPIDKLVNILNTLTERRSERPLFVPIHVPRSYFTYPELVEFVDRFDSETFEVVGPDEFLTLFAHARPDTVVIEPPEGIPPSLSNAYVSGETNELTPTVQAFGEDSIPMDIKAKVTADGLDEPVTATTSTKIEPGAPREVTMEITIPEAAGEGTGQLEYTVNDGDSSTASLPIELITLDEDESFDPPYPLKGIPDCYETVLQEEEDLVPGTYETNRDVRTVDLSSFLKTGPDAIYLRFDDTDTKDPGGTDLYQLTLTADGETIADFTPGTDAESPYLYEADGSGSGLNSDIGSRHRYVDADEYWVYEFPIPGGADSLSAEFDVRNEFLISASTTPEC